MLITCYNCGIQYNVSDFIDQDPNLSGECYDCYKERVEEEEKARMNAIERPPPIYQYFVTITKAPNAKKEDLLENLHKLADRPALRIIHLEYCCEHWTDDSNPHIHVYMRTYRRFDKSRVKAYTKSGSWHIKKAKGTPDEINEYMSKENEIKILIDSNAKS